MQKGEKKKPPRRRDWKKGNSRTLPPQDVHAPTAKCNNREREPPNVEDPINLALKLALGN